MVRVLPVTYSLAGSHRNTTPRPISSGRPRRPQGNLAHRVADWTRYGPTDNQTVLRARSKDWQTILRELTLPLGCVRRLDKRAKKAPHFTYTSVFIDLQDAKWRESDAVFCYQLIRSLVHALRTQATDLALKEPKIEQFEKYPFTALGEEFDHIEGISQHLKKRILLTFDEYERLEEGLKNGKLTTEILNQLRNTIQHRESIVVLFSGSHRFEELHTINWSDYLINVKTLELSFLPAEDARELLTQPVPELDYQPGAIEKILDLTHCQPFLLQAVAFELVNSLNSQNKLEAQADDVEVAAERVLTAAQAYFFYTWQEECSEEEKAVLRVLAANGATNPDLPRDQKAVRSLCQKDILENIDQQYHFTIELFRRWIVKNQDLSESSQSDLQE